MEVGLPIPEYCHFVVDGKQMKKILVSCAFVAATGYVYGASPAPATTMLDCSTKNLMTKEPVSFSVVLQPGTSAVEISGQRFEDVKFSPARITGEYSRPDPAGEGIISKSSFSVDRVTGKFLLQYSLDVIGDHWTDAQKEAVANRDIVGSGFIGHCVKATRKF